MAANKRNNGGRRIIYLSEDCDNKNDRRK